MSAFLPCELFVVVCDKCGLVDMNTVREIADDDARSHRTSKHSTYDKADVMVGHYKEAYGP